MKHLKILHLNNSDITQSSINFLNVEELSIRHNPLVTDISHMSNLKILDISGNNKLAIKNLDLIELYVSYNSFYNSWTINIGHMTNLKVLDIRFSTIGQQDIDTLDLVELRITGNQGIYKVSHMKNLKILYAGAPCIIGQNEINQLDLIELYIHNNTMINNVNHMKNLKTLYIGFKCSVHQNGISQLRLIETLSIVFNKNIHDVTHLPLLKNLIHDEKRLVFNNLSK